MTKNTEQKTQQQLTKELTILAVFTAFSAMAQIFHLGYKTQWGMWIDVVAITWVMALFMFKLRGAFIVAIVSSIVISLVAPETWLGAVAKFLATTPIILSLYLYSRINKFPLEKYAKVKNLIAPIIIAILLRGLLMIVFNYYFAFPIWIPGKTAAEYMIMIPWYIIVVLNLIQTLVDVTLAWFLVYPKQLAKLVDK